MSRSRYESRFYPPSKPREVTDGLRAKSARGAIASTWWSNRFIEVLEQSGVGSRLTRGRNYARRGQVISLDIDAGAVTASVQGSRSRPYRVRIGITAYGKADWSRIEDRLSEDAWFVAQLLSGEMPPDIEQVFEELDLALFPRGFTDLSLDCTCPDYEVPCKHLAAVFYLLAERFDADPFAVLAWRGRDREDLLSRLAESASNGSDKDVAAVSLTGLLDTFYASADTVSAPPRPASTGRYLVDQLPEMPVKVRGVAVTDALRPAYERMAGSATRAIREGRR